MHKSAAPFVLYSNGMFPIFICKCCALYGDRCVVPVAAWASW